MSHVHRHSMTILSLTIILIFRSPKISSCYVGESLHSESRDLPFSVSSSKVDSLCSHSLKISFEPNYLVAVAKPSVHGAAPGIEDDGFIGSSTSAGGYIDRVKWGKTATPPGAISISPALDHGYIAIPIAAAAMQDTDPELAGSKFSVRWVCSGGGGGGGGGER